MAPIINFHADVVEPDLYNDVTELPDPFVMNALLGVSNTYTAPLWFKATLDTPPGDYSDYEQELGTVAAAASAFFTYSFTRVAPVLTDGEYDEDITIVLTAYTDSGYSSEYANESLLMAVHHFDHTDVSWTVTEHADFNGDLHSWTASNAALSNTQFYTSPASCKLTGGVSSFISKALNTGAKTKARIVMHLYNQTSTLTAVTVGGVIKKSSMLPLPVNQWTRLAFNFPVNTNVTTSIMHYGFAGVLDCYVDEIWVISK
jgi:hypothetical protein